MMAVSVQLEEFSVDDLVRVTLECGCAAPSLPVMTSRSWRGDVGPPVRSAHIVPDRKTMSRA